MNYLLEIQAFERKMRRVPLSRDAQLLWYKLMQFANLLWWPETFNVDNKRLMEMSRIGSKHTLIDARNELVEAGLISFTPGKKGTPSSYQLISVADQEGPQIAEDEEPALDDFLCEVKDDIKTYFGYTEALGKELTEITARILDEFFPEQKVTKWNLLQVFYHIKDQYRDQDGQWVMRFPEERKKLLAYALDQARLNGVMTWKYVNGITSRLAERGIKTADQAYDFDYERNRRKGIY